MSMNAKSRQRGRGNTSRFVSSRNMGRPRNVPPPDKNLNFQNDGVYANPRFTHVSTSLVGSVVQVQVRNRSIYEGILKTFNAKMDVVLEMAHLVEEVPECNQHTYSNIPTRDRILDKVIFNLSDIISVTALDVDLDYAVKDTFTDTAISRYNGQVSERDLRELQPWEADGGDEVVTLDGDSSNGWDPNEMFKINAQQFNVQSTYDESLKQYTIPLEKKDTKEFKKREEEALKLAQEIEGSEQYRRRIALENGDGEEEEKYSSVVRPSEQGSQSGGTSGKYIPPMRRNQPQQGRLAQPKPTSLPQNNRPYVTPPPPQQPVTNQHMQSPTQNVQMPVQRLQSPTQHVQPPTQSLTQTVVETSIVTEDLRVNGEREERRQDSVASNSLSNKTSPVPEQSNIVLSTVEGRADSAHTSPNTSKVDRRNSTPKARDAQLQGLKEFSMNFKLTDETKEKDRERERESEGEKENENAKKDLKTEQAEDKAQSEKLDTNNIGDEQDKLKSETVKNSVLNPMAKEFVFNPAAKPFQPKQPTSQVATPPRPQTQSPIVQQMPPQVMPQAHQFYPQYHQIGPPTIMGPPQSANIQPRPKRAVVSVHAQPRGDISAAQQAAQAATGQPLLAQTVPHQGGGAPYTFAIAPMGHHPGMLPQPTGYQPGGQVMPMPPAANPNQRMVQSTSVPMVPTSQHHGGVDITAQQAHSQPIFVNPPSGPPAPMPAHLHQQVPTQHPSHPSHPTPAHMAASHAAPAPQNHQHHQQQGGQINSQSAVHPAPSPVQHTGPGNQQPHPQQHPPSSGTPQPHVQYQQLGMQPQHPPLQPSPHNHTPTSPQAIHQMSMPYTLSSHHAHGHMQGGPSFTVAQAHPHSTQTHTLYTQSTHSPHMQPQIVMMPQPTHHQGQVQHTHPIQHGHPQFHQGHHMAGPGGVHGQSHVIHQSAIPTGLPMSNNPSSVHPSQIHFIHQQVPNQGAPPVQAYQQNQ